MRRATSIEALIRLIDDPDRAVFEHVRREILKSGKEVIPKLHNLLDYESLQPEHVNRIESLVDELHFDRVVENLNNWCLSSEKNLLHGLQIVTSYQFRDLSLAQLEQQIQPYQRRIWLEVNRRMTAFEVVQRMNTMWFDNIGLQIVSKKIATPYNTFINTTLEDMCGTPLAVGLIYSIVAQELNFPIYGVNFPNQFVLAYIDEYRIHHLIEPLGSGGVLFYLAPMNKGEVYIKKQLDELLQLKGVAPEREFFEPSSHSSLLILYLDELIATYQKMERADFVRKYQILKNRILELA
jgi:regulator of sirC expression with transglutaminase-like and TPR domain